MFIKATFNNAECLLNTDYIVDIFNADKWVVDVYVLDIDRGAYKVKQSEIQKLLHEEEPQTERMKTHDYCDICNHKGCGTCIANNLDDYCVPSNYEPTTQTETQKSNLSFEKADTPQTESTGSPIGDYRDGVGAWQTDCGWK
jgi:hypothetical protein